MISLWCKKGVDRGAIVPGLDESPLCHLIIILSL